jgi:hypothetical protein
MYEVLTHSLKWFWRYQLARKNLIKVGESSNIAIKSTTPNIAFRITLLVLQLPTNLIKKNYAFI